ncbi:unknown [Clostridium sp. CAG:448]|nr:unknown [Clostridium sp. CAG:448]
MVEAGEHEGRLQAGQARHVARGGLAGLVLQIHQLVVDHEVDEFAGLWADLVIHLLRGLDHERVVARRLGIAVGEYHLFVIPHDMIDPQALCLRVIKLGAQRHQKFAHLLAEGRNLLFTVIGAPLLQIAHGDVVFVAEILAHLIADADQLIPDLLQTRLVVLVEFCVCLYRGGAYRAVGMLEILLQAVEIERLAVKGNLGSRHDLLILVGQAAFLLAQGNVRFAVQLFLQIHGDKILLAELPLNVRAEGAGGNGFAERNLCAAKRGQGVLQIADLRLVKRIARVKRVADLRNGILREKLAVHAVHLKKQPAQRLVVFRPLDSVLPCGKLRPPRLQIRAFVRQC